MCKLKKMLKSEKPLRVIDNQDIEFLLVDRIKFWVKVMRRNEKDEELQRMARNVIDELMEVLAVYKIPYYDVEGLKKKKNKRTKAENLAIAITM